MHSLLKENLEGYLSGNLASAERLAFEEHVAQCPDCRAQWETFRASAEDIRSLRAPEDLESAPGFYARVMDRIDGEREVPFWSMLLDPAFGRRVVFACLMLLALLGGYVAAVGQVDYSIKHRAEGILAGRTVPSSPLSPEPRFGPNLDQNRSVVLATLVAQGD